MNIAVAQMRVYAGKIEKNLSKMLAYIESESEADLIVFPNMALSSFLPKRIFEEKDYQKRLEKAHQKLVEASQRKMVVWGSVEKTDNFIYVAYQGQLQKIAQRTKHVLSGIKTDMSSKNVIHYQGETLAFYFYDEEIRKVEADYHIILANDPWRKHQVMKRRSFLSDRFNHYLFVNAVSLQNFTKSVLLADGQSVYYDEGKIKMLPAYQETLATLSDPVWENRMDLMRPEDILDHLLSLIRFFDEEALGFNPKWVIGLSGGLDSSVSYGLLNLALGSKRVVPVTMPSQYNRDITKNNATYMANIFGSSLITLPIETLVKDTVSVLEEEGIDASEGLAYENIQARLRGHLLMSVASVVGGVVVNNGNKVETALGYATLYGDAIGALSPLADLSKIEVGILGESINERLGKEVVPKNLLPTVYGDRVEWDFAPSAELKEDQFDPMKWGYHDLLLEYLMRFSKEDLIDAYDQGELQKTALGQYFKFYRLNDREAFLEDLNWFSSQIEKASFKRIQIPPLAVLSDNAFGMQWPEWQGNKKA